MIEDPTPRPNVAMGAFMGFLTMMLGLLLTALQATPTTLEGWLVALQPIVGFGLAYIAPAYRKAWAALIGAGLVEFVLLVHSLAIGDAIFDSVFFLTTVVGLVQAGVTAIVDNTKRTHHQRDHHQPPRPPPALPRG
jgi:hypothetical protein